MEAPVRFDADRGALRLAENPITLYIYDLNGGEPTEPAQPAGTGR